MRGSPVIRALIVFLLLLGLSPLLWRMTSAEAVPQPVAVKTAATAETELSMSLAFTTRSTRVEIKHLGRVVWEKQNPESEEDLMVKLTWPAEGGELAFAVEWPADGPLSAMRVKLEDPERGTIERTLWGQGSRTGVLGFP
jgi:hypothetical protein